MIKVIRWNKGKRLIWTMYCFSFSQNEGVIVLGATNRRDNLDQWVTLTAISLGKSHHISPVYASSWPCSFIWDNSSQCSEHTRIGLAKPPLVSGQVFLWLFDIEAILKVLRNRKKGQQHLELWHCSASDMQWNALRRKWLWQPNLLIVIIITN